MKTLTKKQAQQALYKMGFDHAYRNFSLALKGFQFGWALGKGLKVDGVLGPATSAALVKSLARLRDGKPTMSWHFSFTEFRCKCGGAFSSCKRMWTSRRHVLRLEKYRKTIKQVVRIISGYRCPGHNARVGGARNSQHLYGYSSDFVGVVPADTLADWHIFAGVGQGGRTGLAVHGDSRDLSPYNFTHGTRLAPSRWTYSWG